MLGVALSHMFANNLGNHDTVGDILRFLHRRDWTEARFDSQITCVSDGPSGIIAVGDQRGKVYLIDAQTGHKILSPPRGPWHCKDNKLCSCFRRAASDSHGPNEEGEDDDDGGEEASDEEDDEYLEDDEEKKPCSSPQCRGNEQCSKENLRCICEFYLSADGVTECHDEDPDCPVMCMHAVYLAVDTISYSPNGDMIAAKCGNGKIYLLDSSTAEVRTSLNNHRDHITAVAWSPDGTLLAAGMWATANIFDAQSGKVKLSLSVDAGAMGVRSVAYSPTGDTIAAGCYNGNIYLVNAVTANVELLLTVGSGHGNVRSVSFSPKGDKIAAGCCNGFIYLVDVLTANVKRLMIGHHGQDGCICDCDEDGDLSTYINPKCLVSWHPAQ